MSRDTKRIQFIKQDQTEKPSRQNRNLWTRLRIFYSWARLEKLLSRTILCNHNSKSECKTYKKQQIFATSEMYQRGAGDVGYTLAGDYFKLK